VAQGHQNASQHTNRPSVGVCYYDEAHFKLAITSILIAFAATAVWCLAYPLLFPDRFQADQAKFQQWLADHSRSNK